MPGVAGVHVMAPGNDAGLAEVVAEAARVAQRKTRQTAGRHGRRGKLRRPGCFICSAAGLTQRASRSLQRPASQLYFRNSAIDASERLEAGSEWDASRTPA